MRSFCSWICDPEKRENHGLHAAFKSVFPIFSYSGHAELNYVYYQMGEPLFDENECRQRGLTFGAPLTCKNAFGHL